MEPDGLAFDPNSVAGETTLEGANYEGLRLRFWGYLGEARVRMIIDLGFADPITPSQTMLQFPTILDMPAPILSGYPPETVIAEKLESIVSLGIINSRMKDFHDIWEISRRFDFEGRTLQEAIARTFKARNTLIPQELPVALSDTFVEEKEALWVAFLNRIDPKRSVPLEAVIADLTAFLFPVLQATAEGAQFSLSWGAGKTWKE